MRDRSSLRGQESRFWKILTIGRKKKKINIRNNAKYSEENRRKKCQLQRVDCITCPFSGTLEFIIFIRDALLLEYSKRKNKMAVVIQMNRLPIDCDDLSSKTGQGFFHAFGRNECRPFGGGGWART